MMVGIALQNLTIIHKFLDRSSTENKLINRKLNLQYLLLQDKETNNLQLAKL